MRLTLPSRHHSANWAATALFVLFLAHLVQLAFTACFYNWDMLAYAGAALALEGGADSDIHAAIYQAFQHQTPAWAWRELTEGNYAERMFHHPPEFIAQLGFYYVKPLYVALLAILHRLGIPWVAAMQALSAAFTMLACLVLARWLARSFSWPQAVWLTLTLAYVSRLMDLARGGSPDALSTGLTLLGLYALIAAQRPALGQAILAIAIAARPNNIILFVLCSAYLIWHNRHTTQRWPVYAAWLTAGLGLYVLIGQWGYGWWTLFYHTFIQLIPQPAQFSQPFTLAQYLDTLTSAFSQLWIRGLATPTALGFFALLALLLSWKSPSQRGWLAVMAGTVLISLLLFPAVANWDRFFVPIYLWIAIALATECQANATVPKAHHSRILYRNR